MKFRDPLKMNDWEISRFMLFSLASLAVLWVTCTLNASGFQIPLVQQVAAFVCLLFLPGMATLRILRLHGLGGIETPLYAIGTSISIIIFSGLLLNGLAPHIGISDPLSASHLIIFFSAVVLALCVAGYWRDRAFVARADLLAVNVSPSTLSLLLLPFLAIFGAHLVNGYGINWLILLMLIGIGVVVLVCARRGADTSTYPLAIFVISLSLLLSYSLISPHLWGWDVFSETRIVNIGISNAVWDTSYAASLNSRIATQVVRYNQVPSLSILAPALAQIGNIDVTYLFKVVYPLLFALVPVVLYQLFRKQTNDSIAFLASFFFVSLAGVFALEMPSLARQEIAELFMVLILLLVFDKKISGSTKTFLLVLFSGTTIVSHYGIAYTLMAELIVVFVLLLVANTRLFRRAAHKFNGGGGSVEETRTQRSSVSGPFRGRVITATFVFLFLAMVMGWYAFSGGSLLFSEFLTSVRAVMNSDFASATVTYATGGLQPVNTSLLGLIGTRLNTLVNILIIIGITATFVGRKRLSFSKEYLAFAVTSYGLLLTVFVLPVVFSLWNGSRLIHLCLAILAPFLVIGVLTLFRIPNYVTKRRGTDSDRNDTAYMATAVFLVVLLLFNTGFVSSLALEPDVVLSPSLFYESQPMFVHDQDLAGATWLESSAAGGTVYSDALSGNVLLAYSSLPLQRFELFSKWTSAETPTMIFVCFSEATQTASYTKNIDLLGRTQLQSPRLVGNFSKVYDSGCEIYSTPRK